MHTMEVSKVELIQLIESNDSTLRRILKLLARGAIHAETTVPVGVNKRRISLLRLALFEHYASARLRELLLRAVQDEHAPERLYSSDQIDLIWNMVEEFIPDAWQVPALYEELTHKKAMPVDIIPWALVSVETKIAQQASVYRRDPAVA